MGECVTAGPDRRWCSRPEQHGRQALGRRSGATNDLFDPNIKRRRPKKKQFLNITASFRVEHARPGLSVPGVFVPGLLNPAVPTPPRLLARARHAESDAPLRDSGYP